MLKERKLHWKEWCYLSLFIGGKHVGSDRGNHNERTHNQPCSFLQPCVKRQSLVKIPFMDRHYSVKKTDNPIDLDSLWILHLLACFIVGETCSRCRFKLFCHSNVTPPERRRHNIHFLLKFCRRSSHLPHPPVACEQRPGTRWRKRWPYPRIPNHVFKRAPWIANVWPNNGHSVWLSTTTITCLCFDGVKFKKRETIVQGRLEAPLTSEMSPPARLSGISTVVRGKVRFCRWFTLFSNI